MRKIQIVKLAAYAVVSHIPNELEDRRIMIDICVGRRFCKL